jgi:hypothetical protein
MALFDDLLDSGGGSWFYDLESPPTLGGAPVISDVDLDDSITATQTAVDIHGSDFDTATVEIRQGSVAIEQDVDSQDANTVTFNTTFDPGVGPHLKYGIATLAVINADSEEDTLPINIAAPSGVAYVDLESVNPVSAQRITALPDLNAGDQLEISNVQGGTIADVAVNEDGTFDCAESVTAFDVRAWDVSDAVWGPFATQSLAQIIGTGALTVSAATVAGTGSRGVTGTGALVAPSPTLSGTGSRGHQGTGALVAPVAVISGSGGIASPTSHTGTGDLIAPAAAVNGAGSINGSTDHTGTGDLVAPQATMSGEGSRGSVGTGEMTVSAATVAGQYTPQSITGTGALVVANAAVAGTDAVAATGTGHQMLSHGLGLGLR